MMPSRGLAFATGRAPRLFQAQCRHLSSNSMRIPRSPLANRTPSTSWTRSTLPATTTLGIFARHASTASATPAVTPTPTPNVPAQDAASSFPNLDTITLDNIDLSSASDLASVPGKIGYLHEIGIDYGWGVTSSIQWILEHIHVYSGMPWWGSIATTAVIMRCIMLPIFLRSSDMAARQAALGPVLKPITTRMTEKQREGDREGMMQATAQLMAVRKQAGISMWGMMAPVLVQGVLGFCGYRLIHKMASLPVPGLTDGGFLWLTDLTAPDPFLIMPAVMAATLGMLVRMGGETGAMTQDQINPQMQFFMKYLMPGMIFVIMGWQSGALCVWFAASGALGMGQSLLLQRPAVRKTFGLAPLYRPAKGEAAPSPFSAMLDTLKPADKAKSAGPAAAPSAERRFANTQPQWQAPRQHGQGRVIDVKAEPSKPAGPVEGMVSGFKQRWEDVRALTRERQAESREKAARDAKLKAKQTYEERFKASKRGR